MFLTGPDPIRRLSHSICPGLAMCWTASTLSDGSPRGSPSCAGSSNVESPTRHRLRMSPICSEPDTPSYAGRTICPTDTNSIWGLFTAHPRLKVAWDALQELYGIYEAEDLEQANQALARFADLYDSGQIPEYHDVADKIIAWGEEILAYHPARRATNGPLEGTNNLLQVLRRVAHGFTNHDNYAARGLLVT